MSGKSQFSASISLAWLQNHLTISLPHNSYVDHLQMPRTSTAASSSDIPSLVQLMEEFYAEANYPLDRKWAGNSFSTILSQPSLGSIWLLRRRGKLAGYVVLTVRFSMEYGGLDAFIDDLFVRPEYRRHGVASAGLSALLTECRRRGVRALHVEVAQGNMAAKALYAKFGLVSRVDHRQSLTVELGSDVD